MVNFNSLCSEYGKMFNQNVEVKNGVCSVSIPRNLYVTIQGRPSKGELHAGFSFESLDFEGNALNLGEVVVLEEEIPKFTKQLVNKGFIISALHNHWLLPNRPSFIFTFNRLNRRWLLRRKPRKLLLF